MLSNLSDRFYNWTKGWLIFALFVLDGFVFSGYLFPLVQTKMANGQAGVQMLDLMFFATPAQTFGMIEKYGEAGRALYRTSLLTVDIIYPIVHLLFFGLLISWLYQRGFAPNSAIRKFNVLPLGAWLFDLLENVGIVALITIFPSQPAALATVVMVFTTLKWMFAAAGILLILIGFVMALKNGFKKQA
ncbi:MAG: hypothetical protein HZB18_12490 [Chloroflexi bacterium]|nr:hypothetical protein [Chloroflexota bacterium]